MDDKRVVMWLREMQEEPHEYADMKAHAVDAAVLAIEKLAKIRELIASVPDGKYVAPKEIANAWAAIYELVKP